MFKVTYADDRAPEQIEADRFEVRDGWLWFTQDDEFIIAVKEFDALTVSFEKAAE